MYRLGACDLSCLLVLTLISTPPESRLAQPELHRQPDNSRWLCTPLCPPSGVISLPVQRRLCWPAFRWGLLSVSIPLCKSVQSLCCMSNPAPYLAVFLHIPARYTGHPLDQLCRTLIYGMSGGREHVQNFDARLYDEARVQPSCCWSCVVCWYCIPALIAAETDVSLCVHLVQSMALKVEQAEAERDDALQVRSNALAIQPWLLCAGLSSVMMPYNNDMPTASYRYTCIAYLQLTRTLCLLPHSACVLLQLVHYSYAHVMLSCAGLPVWCRKACKQSVGAKQACL